MRAATEGCVPRVSASHHRFEEESLIVGQSLLQRQTGLGGVVIIKSVGDLNYPDLRIDEESHCTVQEIPVRDEVGIENGHEVSVGLGQGVIDIACLSVRVIWSRQVTHTPDFTKRPEPWTPSDIQHPGLEIRIAEAECTSDSLLENFQRFVVAGHINLDQRHLPPPHSTQSPLAHT